MSSGLFFRWLFFAHHFFVPQMPPRKYKTDAITKLAAALKATKQAVPEVPEPELDHPNEKRPLPYASTQLKKVDHMRERRSAARAELEEAQTAADFLAKKIERERKHASTEHLAKLEDELTRAKAAFASATAKLLRENQQRAKARDGGQKKAEKRDLELDRLKNEWVLSEGNAAARSRIGREYYSLYMGEQQRGEQAELNILQRFIFRPPFHLWTKSTEVRWLGDKSKKKTKKAEEMLHALDVSAQVVPRYPELRAQNAVAMTTPVYVWWCAKKEERVVATQSLLELCLEWTKVVFTREHPRFTRLAVDIVNAAHEKHTKSLDKARKRYKELSRLPSTAAEVSSELARLAGPEGGSASKTMEVETAAELAASIPPASASASTSGLAREEAAEALARLATASAGAAEKEEEEEVGEEKKSILAKGQATAQRLQIMRSVRDTLPLSFRDPELSQAEWSIPIVQDVLSVLVSSQVLIVGQYLRRAKSLVGAKNTRVQKYVEHTFQLNFATLATAIHKHFEGHRFRDAPDRETADKLLRMAKRVQQTHKDFFEEAAALQLELNDSL